MSAIYTRTDADDAPVPNLNSSSLDAGALLVTVRFGNSGGYISFTSPEEVEPWIEAFQQALWLARSARVKLAERAAEQARAAEAEQDAAAVEPAATEAIAQIVKLP